MNRSPLTVSLLATALTLAALPGMAHAQKTTCRTTVDPTGNLVTECETKRRTQIDEMFDNYGGRNVTPLVSPFDAPAPAMPDPFEQALAQARANLAAQNAIQIACIRARGNFKNGQCTF